MNSRHQRPQEVPHSPQNHRLDYESSACKIIRPTPAQWILHPNRQFDTTNPINRLVGQSSLMATLRRQIALFADTNESVLVSGETGTGKDLIARLLHDLSSRRLGPFVPVNCAAIPESLAESELFGSVRGAFTGALQCRNGLFLEANKGTLFLDEFGELSPSLQPKLLRAIELGAIRAVGANLERQIDVRIVAATNRDLRVAVAKKEFRADLLYRVSVLQLTAPPLRHHPDDIPEIVGTILAKLMPLESAFRVSDTAMTQLVENSWAGNVRELANVLRRALILSQNNAIDVIEHGVDSPNCNQILNARHVDWLSKMIDALTRNRGSLAAVARDLGVSIRTVQRRARALGLRIEDFRLRH